MTAAFNPAQIIDQKKRGRKLSTSEIKQFIEGLGTGEVADYQMTAMLMAIFWRGLDDRETQDLTDAMLYSGKTLSFPEKNVVDKHSTGGIGDKTSFILGPLAAACGVKVPMIAGRGLSFTAGTVDKFEAIPGLKTQLSLEEFSQQLYQHGLVMMGQTAEIAPADKKIYALRDVTATVDCIPLITASIMSKKLAEGARGIVFDIKCGDGAFMKKIAEAKKLAKSLGKTAHRFGRSTYIYITNMNRPLGRAVGHSLEIIESIETLKNRGPKDLTELSLELTAGMIYLAGLSKNTESAKKMAKAALNDGRGLEKFRELIKLQGGDARVIEDYSLLPQTEKRTPLLATKSGFICALPAREIGLGLVELGGGRKRASDPLDLAVGMIFHRTVGDKVKKGQAILDFHHHPGQEKLVAELSQKLSLLIRLGPRPPARSPLIYDKQEKLWKNKS